MTRNNSPVSAALTATMDSLLRHAWITGNSANVLRYLGRPLRLLRDHGLIRKVPNRHRYHMTDKGRQLTTALNAMLAASTEQLLGMAA
jgi:hypothetical protein